MQTTNRKGGTAGFAAMLGLILVLSSCTAAPSRPPAVARPAAPRAARAPAETAYTQQLKQRLEGSGESPQPAGDERKRRTQSDEIRRTVDDLY